MHGMTSWNNVETKPIQAKQRRRKLLLSGYISNNYKTFLINKRDKLFRSVQKKIYIYECRPHIYINKRYLSYIHNIWSTIKATKSTRNANWRHSNLKLLINCGH